MSGDRLEVSVSAVASGPRSCPTSLTFVSCSIAPPAGSRIDGGAVVRAGPATTDALEDRANARVASFPRPPGGGMRLWGATAPPAVSRRRGGLQAEFECSPGTVDDHDPGSEPSKPAAMSPKLR
jgi:hypothetical protein